MKGVKPESISREVRWMPLTYWLKGVSMIFFWGVPGFSYPLRVLAHQAVWHPKSNKTHTPATNKGVARAVQPVLSGLRMQWSSRRSCTIEEARQLMRNKFVVDV